MGNVIKKALPVLAAVAGIALAIPSGGTSLLAAGLGVSGTVAGGIAAGLSLSASLLSSTSMPKIPQSETQLSRLQARLDTQAPRKMVLGRTAMPADIRYYEGSGEDERVIEYIIAVAAHKVREISELWIEDELAWSETGGIAPQFVDYLGVEGYKEGRADNTRAINGGARWGSDDRLTGCAYLYVRVNRLGATENEQSPFANGLPGRVTIVGEGMPMYDPRFDSTVGGSGSMRIANQNTWGPSSGNPIIQSLNVLLGWRINGKLSVGGGLPAKYINLDSVMTAANACDEDIVLSGGGTQPRYRTAGTFSTDDAPMNIVGALLAGCAGDLLDSDGQLSFLIKTNTLAVPAVTFDDHDLLSAGRWDPMGGQTNLSNIIAGNFTDPSARSLYQPVPYPSVELPSEDGIDRTAPLDFGVVENGPQSERLAKQTLQRMQYPGLFSAEYNMKGMAAKVGSIVWQSYSPRGWLNKPFRVVSQKPSRSGRIALVLREEHEDIYAWEAEDSAAVQPAEPVKFDFKNTGPILLAREAAKVAEWPRVIDSDGTMPEDNATFGSPDGSPVGDRLAEEVTGAIDELNVDFANLATTNAEISAEVDDVIATTNDLIETYGSTASAAASAANAQQSEINAGIAATASGGSATSAAADAVAAASASNLAARYSLTSSAPTTIAPNLFTDAHSGAPESVGDTTRLFSTDSDGPHFRLDAQNEAVLPKHVIPVTAGSVVDVTARLKRFGSGNETQFRFYVRWLDKDFNTVAITFSSIYDLLVSTPQPFSDRFVRPADNSIVYARIAVRKDTDTSTRNVGVFGLYARDATAQSAAEAQAAISQANAAIATAEAAAAQTSSTVAARYSNSSIQPTAVERRFFVDNWGGDPALLNDSALPLTIEPNFGRGIRIDNDGIYARTRSVLPVSPGLTVHTTAVVEQSGAIANATIAIAWLDTDYNVLSYSFPVIGLSLNYDPATFTYATVVPANPQIRYARVGVRKDAGFSGSVSVYGLTMRDKSLVQPVEASITEMRGAAADSSGNRAAFLKLVAAASGGNPAMFEILASAGGSKIGLVGDVVAIGNSVDGIVETVFRAENGQAVMSDAIFRRARVRPIAGSQIFHDVELRPRDYLAPDGQTTQYEGGASYGALPEKIVPDLSGLPALAEGHRYDIRATNVTASQFRARAKRISPGPMTERVGSTQATSGSVPTRRVNKPVSENAYNGEYEFRWTATIVKIDEYSEGAGNLWATYQGTYDLYIYNGSSWIKVGSQTVNGSRFSSSGPNPPTISVAATKVVNSDINAPSGSQVFGVHPATSGSSVSSFNSVSFTTQSGTTETPVSGLIKWSVYPPRP